jgi:hypothetical protein
MLAETDSGQPLLTRMPWGAGEVMYLATDELWRWRRFSGDVHHEATWMSMLRKLGRARVEASAMPVRLECQQHIALGATAGVRLRVTDPDLVKLLGANLTAVLIDSADREVARLSLQLEGDLNEVQELGSGSWFTTNIFPQEGDFRLQLEVPVLRDAPGRSAVPISVRAVGGELTDRQADHGTLARISGLTGGRVLTLADLPSWVDQVPVEAVEKIDSMPHPLWHRWWALAPLLILLGVEWIVRRLIRLI